MILDAYQWFEQKIGGQVKGFKMPFVKLGACIIGTFIPKTRWEK